MHCTIYFQVQKNVYQSTLVSKYKNGKPCLVRREAQCFRVMGLLLMINMSSKVNALKNNKDKGNAKHPKEFEVNPKIC